MAENPTPDNPAGLVNDSRYRNITLSLSYLHLGQNPTSGEMSIRLQDGEGEAWYTPGYLPVEGSIQDGQLIYSSECFPRFAPLTMTITGADLRFHVRSRQVLSFSSINRTTAFGIDDEMLRLYCTSPWLAACRFRLRWYESVNRLVLSRINELENHETPLEVHVLKGAIEGTPGAKTIDPDGTVITSRITVRRDDQGEITLQMHGARLVWDFHGGRLWGLMVYESRGLVASQRLLDLSGAGVSVSSAFVDSLP